MFLTAAYRVGARPCILTLARSTLTGPFRAAATFAGMPAMPGVEGQWSSLLLIGTEIFQHAQQIILRACRYFKRTGDHEVQHDAAAPHIGAGAVEEVVHQRLRRCVCQRPQRALRIAVHLRVAGQPGRQTNVDRYGT